MKPYYQDKWVTIYHGDCFEIMPQLGVKELKADSVVTDPPYRANDIGPNHRQYSQGMNFDNGDYPRFCNSWFSLAKTLSDRLAFTCGIAHLWLYPPAHWILCWHKPSAISYNKMGGFNAWEPVLIYGKPKGRFGQDYIRQDPLNFATGPERKHPCPKPMKVWDWLIQGMAKPSDLILDPFLGAGTSCVSAKKLSRQSIGIEIEEKYCEIAAKRCCQEVMELVA